MKPISYIYLFFNNPLLTHMGEKMRHYFCFFTP